MESQPKYQERVYNYLEVCAFRKTKDLFGGLSNMAPGFPIKVNGRQILTAEALYQACRFPHLPEVQQKIIAEKSPMTAKMVSKPFRASSRPDWDIVRTDIMYWCLKVKLAQNFMTFGQLLETTHDRPIVEDSSKDAFWGAVQDKQNPGELKGVNALGRLLMKLRQEYNSPKRFDLLFVEPLRIEKFILLDEEISVIDDRERFVNSLYKSWNGTAIRQVDGSLTKTPASAPTSNMVRSNVLPTVAEPSMNKEKKEKGSKAGSKKDRNNQPKLPL